MEVLELKPIENKKIVAYMIKKAKKDFPNSDMSTLKDFIEKKGVNFVTVDFDINMKAFSNSQIGQELKKLRIPCYQVDIPEYAMGYLYEEIVEKEELLKELAEEYTQMDEKDSYKGQSLKNWIDMVHQEIETKEVFLSLKLRPQWIVKKMLDIAKSLDQEDISFVHLVQEDICEDICSEVVSNLRDLNVRVVQYTKKHNVQNIIF